MDQDQDDAGGFVPRNGCGLLGLPKMAGDEYPLDRLHLADRGSMHRAVNIRRAWERVVGG